MSDIFALNPKGKEALEDHAIKNPLDPSTATYNAWTGFSQQAKRLMSGSASASRTLGVAVGGVGVLVDKAAEFGDNLGRSDEDRARREALGLKPRGVGAAEWAFENLAEGVGQDAVNYWTPDAGATGSAANVLGTLFDVVGRVPQMFGTTPLFLADSGVAPAVDASKEGASLSASYQMGATHMAANAIGMVIPAAFGSKLLTRVSTGVAGNVVVGAATDATSNAILKRDGLEEYASLYDWKNPQARLMDALMGGAFALRHHATAERVAKLKAGAEARSILRDNAAAGIAADRMADARAKLEDTFEAYTSNEILEFANQRITELKQKAADVYPDEPILNAKGEIVGTKPGQKKFVSITAAERAELEHLEANKNDAHGISQAYQIRVDDTPEMLPSQRDAVLVANNADHLTRATLPGDPREIAAQMQHKAAIELALAQLSAGRQVDVSGKVDLNNFELRPEMQPTVTPGDWIPRGELGAHIRSAADELGIDAVDLATAISFETGGTFDPKQVGPTTKWGQHVGLIQMGEPQRAKYGYDPNGSPESQMKAIVAYMKDAGVRPGMGMLDVYSAINAGRVGKYSASDTAAGGTRGTVRDKVEQQMADHRKKAGALFKHGTAENFGLPEVPRTVADTDPLLQAIPLGERGHETARIDTPEREAMRDQWVDDHFKDAQQRVLGAGERPIAWIMGGGGASGKGTILTQLRDNGTIDSPGAVHIDPDNIKTKQIPEYDALLSRGDGRAAAIVHEESSVVATRVLDRAIDGKFDLVLDRTLGDEAKGLDYINRLKAAGYEVNLYGVTIDPGEAVVRAVKRAQDKGRYVPLPDLLKAHKGFNAALKAYSKIVDSMIVFDNTGASPVPVLMARQGRMNVLNGDLYNQIRGRSKIDEKANTHRGLQDSEARSDGEDPGNDARAMEGGDPEAGSSGVRDGGQAQLAGGSRGSEAPGQLDPGEFPAQGAESVVVTERGLRVPVQWAVVDAADLVTSHDDALNVNPQFPADLQPRDRTRAASEQQIARISNQINPELLADSPKAADGAPIVGQDKVVESGNARTIALRRAYGAGRAEDYRAFVAENAARFGIDPNALNKIENPVLVRVNLGDQNRAEFARQANESTVASMSATEQAMADAARLPDMGDLQANDDGTINMRASAKFVAGFIEGVGPNERAAMSTADGQLSQQGQSRIRNAVFARAYGDADLVALMSESTDANVKNILAGLLRGAPAIARLREMIAEGGRFGPDISSDLVMAVRKFSQLRSDGVTVDQFEAQGDFFGAGGLTPRARDLLRTVGDNSRAPKRMAEFLQRYVDTVDALGDPRQADVFGGAGKDAGDAISIAAKGSVEPAAPKQAGSLFNAAGRPTKAEPLNITPENRPAFEAIAANPDLKIMGEDGTLRHAADYLAEGDVEAAQIADTARAVEAAANCLLRNVT